MRLFSRTDNSDSSVRYATPEMNTEGLLEIENGNEACSVFLTPEIIDHVRRILDYAEMRQMEVDARRRESESE